MQLYIDLDSGQFITDPNFKAPVDTITFKRGDSATIRLSFVRSNAVVALAEGAEVRFGIKEAGKYDGDFLVYTADYTLDGTSYLVAPSFNTSALNTALNSGDSNDTNDVASLSAMLEISWSEDSGTNWKSSAAIVAAIQNDVIKGVEGTPLELPDAEDWLADQFSYLEVEASPLVTLVNDETAEIVELVIPAGTWDVQGMISFNFASAGTIYFEGSFEPALDTWENWASDEAIAEGTKRWFSPLNRVVLTEETALSIQAIAEFSAGNIYGGGRITARKVPA